VRLNLTTPEAFWWRSRDAKEIFSLFETDWFASPARGV